MLHIANFVRIYFATWEDYDLYRRLTKKMQTGQKHAHSENLQGYKES